MPTARYYIYYRISAPTLWCIVLPRPYIARRNLEGAPDKAALDPYLFSAKPRGLSAVHRITNTAIFRAVLSPICLPFSTPGGAWQVLVFLGVYLDLVATSPDEVVLFSPLAPWDLTFRSIKIFISYDSPHEGARLRLALGEKGCSAKSRAVARLS